MFAFQELATETIAGARRARRRLRRRRRRGLVRMAGGARGRHRARRPRRPRHPRRARRAQRDIEAAPRRCASPRVSGIHVGLVGRADRPIRHSRLRRDLNVAARLESFAEPGTVVMSSAAHTLAGDRFHTEDLGEHALKGVATGRRLRVDGARAPDDDASAAAFGATLVGRDDELAAADDAWRESRGRGRTVVITGEPGVGKSQAARQPARDARGRAAPLAGAALLAAAVNTAFHPVAEMVRANDGIRLTDEPDEQRRMIRAVLPATRGKPSCRSRRSSAWHGRPPGPEKFRHDLMEALHCWLSTWPREAPVVRGRGGPAVERPLDARADARAPGSARRPLRC